MTTPAWSAEHKRALAASPLHRLVDAAARGAARSPALRAWVRAANPWAARRRGRERARERRAQGVLRVNRQRHHPGLR